MIKKALLTCLATTLACVAEKKNILFLPVDDMKPMLGCYGDEKMKTPNFDRLAGMGTTFLNAQCQQAVCGPSRASLLTGWRPDRTKVWDLKTRIRDINPDVVTLPQYFRENDYTTVGIGKTYDPRSVDGRKQNDPASWSVPYMQPDENKDIQMGFANPEFVARVKELKKKYEGEDGWWDKMKSELGGVPAVEGTEDVPDNTYDDGIYAEMGVEQIKKLAQEDAPFFLAVGFKKPHLPFVAPKKYWDLYEREEIALETYQQMPEGAPALHFQDSWELKNGSYQPYEGVEEVTEAQQRELIHGYMACISYIDTQIGKLLDALEENGVAENTIVVMWGDHGFHLGDHGMFCKHTSYEQAARVPLIFAEAAVSTEKANQTGAPVEFVDVFPTLVDLAGLEMPDYLDGVSLKPLMTGEKESVKPYAVSQYDRPDHEGGGKMMGYAYRSENLRYIEWVPKKGLNKDPKYRELYDYTKDPLETKNLIEDPAYTEEIAKAAEFSKKFRLEMSKH